MSSGRIICPRITRSVARKLKEEMMDTQEGFKSMPNSFAIEGITDGTGEVSKAEDEADLSKADVERM